MTTGAYTISLITGERPVVTHPEEESHHIPVNQWRSIVDELRNKQSNQVTQSKKSDSFKPLFDQVTSILDQKNDQYSSDPISVLGTNDLLCQIKIKAVRAELAISEEKRQDELLDIIVYSLLTLNKMYASHNAKIEENHVR